MEVKMSKSVVLSVCKADMSSYEGFVWPESGHVVAPDWKNDNRCGDGLHGWLEGQGDSACSDYTHLPDAKYLVLEVDTETIVDLKGKCKFPEAEVIFVGNRSEALDYIERMYPQLSNAPLLFATRTAGNYGTATVGDSGTAKAGDSGTAKAGYNGVATAGNYGTATADIGGTAMAGVNGVIRISCFDERKRTITGYIGENGLLANTRYKLGFEHTFIEAD
ncbi:MAG TPA: hypothetical protein PKD40_09050 [Saprospiraceae bacterium]|nr:hypothetical protein [Saprospiraceae bacterium]